MRKVAKSWWSLTEEWGSQEEYLSSTLQVNDATCILCGDNISLTDRSYTRVQTFGTKRATTIEWFAHFFDKHYIFADNDGYLTKVRCWWPHD